MYGLGLAGNAAFSGGADGNVIAWRLDQPPEPLELRTADQGWFYGLAFSQDGSGVFSTEGGTANVARHWNLAGGRLNRAYPGHTDQVTTLAISRNAEVLFTGAKDATARMWDVNSGEGRSVFRGHTGPVVGVACPPDAGWLATAGEEGEVRLWSPTSGSLTRKLITRPVKASRLASDPDGRLLVASFLDGTIVVWETGTWQETGRYAHGELAAGETLQAIALAVSPDGKRLVSGGTDRSLRAWDLETGTPLWTKGRDDLAAPVLSIAFLPGGKQFVTGGGVWGAPGEVKVWNALTGENTFTLRGPAREIYGVAVNPADGSVAASSHEGAIKVFGLPTPFVAGQAAHHRADLQFRRGEAHRMGGELDKALGAYREAIAIEPTSAEYHLAVARVLFAKSDPEGALAAARTASRLEPTNAAAHSIVGTILYRSGDLDGAAEARRTYVRLLPGDPVAHQHLGVVLLDQGKLTEATERFQAALKLDPKSLVIERNLRQAEKWAAINARLPNFANGTDAPSSPTEAAEVAYFYQQPFRKNYDLAVKFWRDAFGGDPESLATPNAARWAAGAAVMLAAGSDPTVTLGDDEWHFLHATARSWLSAELDFQSALIPKATPNERQVIRNRLMLPLSVPTLRAAREPAALAAMPADERAAWEAYWKKLAAAIESTRPVPATK